MGNDPAQKAKDTTESNTVQVGTDEHRDDYVMYVSSDAGSVEAAEMTQDSNHGSKNPTDKQIEQTGTDLKASVKPIEATALIKPIPALNLPSGAPKPAVAAHADTGGTAKVGKKKQFTCINRVKGIAANF